MTLPADLIKLDGVRCVRVSEPGDGVRWQEGLIKQLTCGEPTPLREVRGAEFDASPDFPPIKYSGPIAAGSEDPEQ